MAEAGKMRALSRVPPSISRDTVQALETLLDGAKRGEVVGLAFVAMLPLKRYFVDLAGEAVRDPTYARGAVAALEDELRDLIQERADADPAVDL